MWSSWGRVRRPVRRSCCCTRGEFQPRGNAAAARRHAGAQSPRHPDRSAGPRLQHTRARDGFDACNSGADDRRSARRTRRRASHYPWKGGVGWYNKAVTTPVIGPLLAHTVTLPLGLLLTKPGARGVFLPQPMPDGFVKNTATWLLLRPREFLAN